MVYKFGEGQTTGPTYVNGQSGYTTGMVGANPYQLYYSSGVPYAQISPGATFQNTPNGTVLTAQYGQKPAGQTSTFTGYTADDLAQQKAYEDMLKSGALNLYTAQQMGYGGCGTGSGAGGDMSAYLNAGKMLTAPMSDEEKQALANASSLVEMIMDMPYFQDTEMGQAAQAAIMEALSGQFPEEYYQNAIYNPTLKQYQEDVLPSIQEAFAGPGTYWGSERANAERKAGENLQDYLTQRRAELAQWAKTRQDTGVGTSMAYQSLVNQEPLGRLGANETLMAMGAIPRSIEQHALDIAYQEFLRTRPSSNPYISQAMGMLNIPTIAAYSPSGVTTNAFQGLGNNINNLMQYYAMQQAMSSGNYGLSNTAWTPNYSTYTDYYY